MCVFEFYNWNFNGPFPSREKTHSQSVTQQTNKRTKRRKLNKNLHNAQSYLTDEVENEKSLWRKINVLQQTRHADAEVKRMRNDFYTWKVLEMEYNEMCLFHYYNVHCTKSTFESTFKCSFSIPSTRAFHGMKWNGSCWRLLNFCNNYGPFRRLMINRMIKQMIDWSSVCPFTFLDYQFNTRKCL